MSEWSATVNETVSGPYSEGILRAHLEDGTLPPSCVVWGRGLENWKSASEWLREDNEKKATAKQAVVAIDSKSKSKSSDWHFAVDGASRGPFSREDMIKEMKLLKNADQILVWTKGMSSWADVYEIEEIRTELGLERRDAPRANIVGTVTFTCPEGEKFTGNLKSISASGCGAFSNNSKVATGATLQIEIQSSAIQTPILAKATVQYVRGGGYAGFKFTSITDESKSLIMDYVKSKVIKPDFNFAA